ncbi:OLC1v1031362C1 [Oldenlandia corymbosa var. corymbosa]|uniref:protein-tyrosine-phosphatase n=1 Tax=Oldenlandia corymbosa var. corymbosa TaxID=529605 RepID=A0AAV1CIE6_OLDCO|nr:OLC1v1031362C1 [Oldenlandia corymbosa var. corymbosa]
MNTAGTSSDQKMKVYIWDMDETLILLKSLITGTYAEASNGLKNVEEGMKIGKLWEDLILQICDDHFFYEQVDFCNEPYLDATADYDNGRDLSNYDFNHDGFGNTPDEEINKIKLAYRHRVIAERYNKGLHSLLDENLLKSWDSLYDSTDRYTDTWLSSARECLEQCSTPSKDLNPQRVSTDGRDGNVLGYHDVNVLVTSGALIPSLVKCLLFRVDGCIACENVYSSWEVGKRLCFSLIRERFSSRNAQFCVIGDGVEECEAAEAMKWPFVKVDPFSTRYHRFPGLSLKDMGLYLSVVYGNSDGDNDEE